MTRIDINAILDRWHAGQSAGVIVRELKLRHVKQVYMVVSQARQIKDRRAVVHVDADGTPFGSYAHANAYALGSRAPRGRLREALPNGKLMVENFPEEVDTDYWGA